MASLPLRQTVLPKSQQDVFSRVSGFVTQSRVRPRTACHNPQQTLSLLATSWHSVGSGTLLCVLITVPGSISPQHVLYLEPEGAMGLLTHGALPSQWSMQLHRSQRHKLEAVPDDSGKCSENFSRKTRQSAFRMLSTPTCRLAPHSATIIPCKVLLPYFEHRWLLRILLIHWLTL